MHLPDDVVPRVPIEAQHDKVQGHGLQIVQGESVEGKVFIVGGVSGVADDPESSRGLAAEGRTLNVLVG